MNYSKIHFSWEPLKKEFNTDSFLYFKNEILTNEKYYPDADEVFRVFSMPISEIKVVVLDSNKKEEKLEKQGVFFLPLTLTKGADIEHKSYWEPFIKKVIYFISKSNPSIWVSTSKEAEKFLMVLPRKTILNVKGYDDETIKLIPVNSAFNYVFTEKYIDFRYINILLKKKGKQKINWLI